MNTDIKLNDFASFDRAIFNGTRPIMFTKRAWRSWATDHLGNFYRDLVIPIDHFPNTIAEYQFCHYVLWMTIWAKDLSIKPVLTYKDGVYMDISTRCFACEYMKNKKRAVCPIVAWQQCRCTTKSDSEYRKWSIRSDKRSAYRIAHLKWEE